VAGASQYEMQAFDQAIFGLYSKGLVTLEEALRWASNVDDFKLKVAGISTTADMARDEMGAKRAPAPPAPPPAPPHRPRRRRASSPGGVRWSPGLKPGREGSRCPNARPTSTP